MMDHFDDAFTEALYRKNAKLQAENKRLREALEWQPIETAPKDGTVLMGYFGDMPTFFSWHEDHRWQPVVLNVQTCHWVFTTDKLFSPTHWKPLPEPPTGEE